MVHIYRGKHKRTVAEPLRTIDHTPPPAPPPFPLLFVSPKNIDNFTDQIFYIYGIKINLIIVYFKWSFTYFIICFLIWFTNITHYLKTCHWEIHFRQWESHYHDDKLVIIIIPQTIVQYHSINFCRQLYRNKVKLLAHLKESSFVKQNNGT